MSPPFSDLQRIQEIYDCKKILKRNDRLLYLREKEKKKKKLTKLLEQKLDQELSYRIRLDWHEFIIN